jgi:hypothetical protein
MMEAYTTPGGAVVTGVVGRRAFSSASLRNSVADGSVGEMVDGATLRSVIVGAGWQVGAGDLPSVLEKGVAG